jgi:hypothetical protein
MLLLINNLHKNVRDNCSINLITYVCSEPSTGKVLLALLYHITQWLQPNSLKIPVNYLSFVSLV